MLKGIFMCLLKRMILVFTLSVFLTPSIAYPEDNQVQIWPANNDHSLITEFAFDKYDSLTAVETTVTYIDGMVANDNLASTQSQYSVNNLIDNPSLASSSSVKEFPVTGILALIGLILIAVAAHKSKA